MGGIVKNKPKQREKEILTTPRGNSPW